MFFRVKKVGSHSYVQLVENSWEDGSTKQRVLHTLGSLDTLRQSGQIDALLASGSRLSQTILILTEHQRGELQTTPSRSFGSVLVFERLWKLTGCREVLQRLADGRKFGFSLERAVFFTVLHRLLTSGSDRSAVLTWQESYQVDGTDDLKLHQLYRTMAFLGEELAVDEQAGATPFSPRCVKDEVEEALFARRRDLFSDLELVFFDTTSIYFEGEGGETLGQHGHSKDHRKDLKQMVVGMILDGQGRPVCCEMWPGNTTDVKTLIPIVDRLKRRFAIVRVCFIADRGMISKETVAELEERNMEYILGARMRAQKEVSENVLTQAGSYDEITPERRVKKDPSPLKVKEVWVDKRRYVVCRNEEEARKDAHDREAIVTSLREALLQGAKSLVGNKGYRRYLSSGSEGPVFSIDEARIQADARYDGMWVLRTNTTLPTKDVALTYKQLWMVEEMFRSMKSLLTTRPIWHKCDETIRGHVFCTYLALVLRKALEDRLEAAGVEVEWAQMIADLNRLSHVDFEKDGKRFRIRTQTSGCAGKVLQAVGVAVPSSVRLLAETPETAL